SRVGTLALDIAGAPVRINGRMSLRPSGEGTVQSFSGEITASVPLFGRHIEKAAAGAVDKVLAVERSIGLEFLAGRCPARSVANPAPDKGGSKGGGSR